MNLKEWDACAGELIAQEACAIVVRYRNDHGICILAACLGITNKKAGEAYMEQLRKDKSFIFTKSGLAYKMLKEGKGTNFTKDDVVNTIYVGKHLDGTVFESSEGEPMPFISNQEIEGVSEMLQLMKPGGKAIVVIPGNLAYGAMGVGGLGPNETLIFEIETVDRR